MTLIRLATRSITPPLAFHFHYGYASVTITAQNHPTPRYRRRFSFIYASALSSFCRFRCHTAITPRCHCITLRARHFSHSGHAACVTHYQAEETCCRCQPLPAMPLSFSPRCHADIVVYAITIYATPYAALPHYIENIDVQHLISPAYTATVTPRLRCCGIQPRL